VRLLLRRLAVLVPVVALAVGLGAGAAVASSVPPEPTGPTGRIAGVLTGPDGPVAGADVSASSSTGSSGSVRTGLDGTYAIDRLAPAEYVVRFDPPAGSGLVTEYYADALSRPAATPVRVDADATTVVDAELARSARLSGRVTDSRGEPVEGIRVAATTEASESYGYADTAADGTWTITDDLPPGTYRVSYTAWDERYVPAFYPGVADVADATWIDLASGQRVDGLDVVLRDAGALRVVVTDASGVPAEGVPVRLELPDGSVLSSTGGTNAEGVFQVGLVPVGTVRVGFGLNGDDQPFVAQWFKAPHGTTTRAARASDVTITAGATTEISAALRTGATITGTVRRPDGTPVSAYVGAYLEDGSLVYRTTLSAADGTYTLRGLTPGRYGVYVQDGQLDGSAVYYGTGTRPALPNVRVTGTAQTSGIDITVGTRFADVQPTAPFAADIEWVAAQGIDEGTTVDGVAVFDAAGRVSREALAVVLYRAAGSPAVPTPARSPFRDVADDAPHLTEMVWASAHGLPAVGSRFLPARWVTRAEAAHAVGTAAGSRPDLGPGSTLHRGELARLVHVAFGAG